MIKKAVKYVFLFLMLYAFLCFLTPYNGYLKSRSIKNQISYLSGIIDDGYDDILQQRFPEGKVFSNALLALSVIEYTRNYSVKEEGYAHIVDNCIKRLVSKSTRKIFHENIEPKYGIFYTAWTNLVMQEYKDSPLFSLSTIQEEIAMKVETLSSRIIETQTDSLRILDTYAGTNWPADNLVAMTSIASGEIQASWLQLLLDTGTHPSGLIHHVGSNPSELRGSSQALISYFLHKMQYKEMESYYVSYQEKFVDNYLGIQLVKEHEDGSSEEDYDSGPIIFGYGASATIMQIKTDAVYSGNKRTWAVMNLIGLPFHLFGKKYYLFKQEAMFDLFMLWASVEN